MTTFKEIRGQLIKSLSSDPSPATAGDMWYNSTSQTLKGVVLSGTWSSGGTLGTARAQGGSSGSTQNDALFAGGITSSQVANTEEYNGSSWTAGGDLTTARFRLAGANLAPQTAGLVFGGRAPSPPGGSDRNETEEYNGSSWSEQNNLSTARRALAGAGIQTSAIAVGGEGPLTTSTEEYNGSSWTGGGAYPTATMGMGSFGATGTAAIAVGGADAAAGGLTRGAIYDGSAWTAISAIPVGRSYMAGFGTTTSGMIAGGMSAPGAAISNATSYDGTNWTVENSLATARFYNGGGGSSGTSGLTFAGLTPPATNTTEEFSLVATTKTFTTS